jgi:hypothetical protein
MSSGISTANRRECREPFAAVQQTCHPTERLPSGAERRHILFSFASIRVHSRLVSRILLLDQIYEHLADHFTFHIAGDRHLQNLEDGRRDILDLQP